MAIGPAVGLQETGPVPLAFLEAVAAALAVGAVVRAPRPGSTLLGLAAALLVGLLTGALGARVETPSIEPGRRVRLEGEVASVAGTEDGVRLTLEAASVGTAEARFRASLFTADPVRVLPGQRVLIETRLKPMVPGANPGEWNRAAMLARRGQGFSGGFDGNRVVVLSGAPAWRTWLAATHDRLDREVHRLAPDSDSAALFLTLAAGLRAELDDEVEDEFARSGLAHVLSVSGLHVAALAFAIFFALRWLLVRVPGRHFRRVDARQVAAPLAIPLVWSYVLFTGLQAPAVRSAVMCSLLLGGHALLRRSDPLNALAVAAGAMALLDPSCLLDLSVQLSFTAVLALIVLAPGLRALVPLEAPSHATSSGWRFRLVRMRETVLQTFIASLAVTLASAPLVLLAFQRVGIAGLLSNVVCLPLCAVLTLLAASGAALFVLAPGLATPVLIVGTWLSKLLLWGAHLFSQLPGAAVRIPGPSLALMVAWWAGLAAFVLLRGRWRAFAVLAPLAACLHLGLPIDRGTLDVTFLAVGHGDAIVLSSSGRHALIDGGGVPQGSDTGRRYVVPFLRAQRIDRLELAVLTHPHPDHALGLASTLREVPAERLWLPAGAGRGELVNEVIDAADGAELQTIELGQPAFQLGQARLEVLGPPVDRLLLKGENDRSIVLRVRHGAVTFLLPGDVEEAAEEGLEPGEVTVLKAPHHGSRSSSTDALVARTRPKFVVFCVGRYNRFGFPHEEIVERWEAIGARCYRTDLDGAVTFHSDGRSVEVETFLERRSARRAPVN